MPKPAACASASPSSSEPAGGTPQPSGLPSVLMGGRPAVRMGDAAGGAGSPAMVISGCPTVLIGGRPAARIGDQTSLSHPVTHGCSTVVLG